MCSEGRNRHKSMQISAVYSVSIFSKISPQIKKTENCFSMRPSQLEEKERGGVSLGRGATKGKNVFNYGVIILRKCNMSSKTVLVNEPIIEF